MRGRITYARTLAVVLSLLAFVALPAVASAQATQSNPSTQQGTTGSGSGSQSGSVSNTQTNAQTGTGPGVQQNATNQNCVAGRDCVNNNITNQNQNVNSAPAHVVAPRRVVRFTRVAPVRRPVAVNHVRLAFTGLDLRVLFLLGGLITAAGLGVLTAQRRGMLAFRRR